jgi:hypothetical protein
VSFILAQGVIGFAWLLPTIVFPLYLVSRLGMPAALATAVFAVNAVLQVALQTPVTAALARCRRITVVVASTTLLLAAIAVLPVLTLVTGTVRAGLAMVAGILVGLAAVAYVPAANSLVTLAAPVRARGRALSLFHTVIAASGAVGPVVVGVLFDRDPRYLWLLLGCLVSVGALTTAWLRQALPGSATGAPADSTPATEAGTDSAPFLPTPIPSAKE